MIVLSYAAAGQNENENWSLSVGARFQERTCLFQSSYYDDLFLYNKTFSNHRPLITPLSLFASSRRQVVSSADVSFDDPAAFSKAIRAVRSDIGFTDWCLVGYKDQNTLQMVGGGPGGLEAMLDATEQFGVNYGLLRVSAI